MAYGLSKSKLMSFRQCPRRLWLERHQPGLAAEIPGQQAAFDTGHEVGDIARRLYDASGVLIDYDDGLTAALRQTRELLSSGPPATLFEATFERDGLLVRTDILQFGASARMIEVKASASVKPEHLADCAIQAWVLNAAAVRPARIALAHVDSHFVYGGAGDYAGLLSEQDLTTDIAPLLEQVPGWLQSARRVLAGAEPPAAIGSRCFKPYECPFRRHCWPQVKHPLTELPGIGRKLDQLLALGHHDLLALPEKLLTTSDQRRVWRAANRGEAELTADAGRQLRALGYPRYYLDFETVAPAVPRFAGTRPYQQLPFQWSLHVEQRDGTLRHHEFLDLSGDLPLRPAAESLLAVIGTAGPVFMYTDFERRCLQTLAAYCPDLSAQLEAVVARLVDLLPLARQSYYHPAMGGSWSIKKLLPTIAPQLEYGQLNGIREGVAAQQAYVEAVSPGTGEQRRAMIRDELLQYCGRDTLALVTLAGFLEKAA